MAAKLHQNLDWTPEKLGVLSSMWENYTVPEIADALGDNCSPSAIYAKAQRMGLGKKPKEAKARALRNAMLAQHQREWDAAMDAELRVLWTQKTIAQIARQFQLPYETVRRRARALGMPKNHRATYLTRPFKRTSPLDICEGHRALDTRSLEILRFVGVAP